MSNTMDKSGETKLKPMAAELAKTSTQQLLKLTVETALGTEMEEHLGYEKHDPTS
ncbi:hypothetical protein [Alcanivorax jadensis]|uniref:hypothetical protein n=1 Tax=Alcanivorax jadensis TaxID=64988 RepID=UPI0024091260|nr:hypothetical protein [Alcanivorax jadensis]MDF1637861.1 hypothetical protein [Alcanivorax jadensis]